MVTGNSCPSVEELRKSAHWRKMFCGFLLVLAALTILADFASAQEPAAKGNALARSTRAVGQAFKDMGSDIRHSPEYRSFFFLDSTAQASDTASSCVGASRGFQDSNILLGHTSSCARITFTTVGLHLVKWAIISEGSRAWEAKCSQEKFDDVHGYWEKSGASAHSCAQAFRLMGLITVPFHAVSTYSNVCAINGGCNAAVKK